MIALDEDALICDFAETYHVYDYRALSANLAAVLACGLRDDSRIKMKLSGAKASFSDLVRVAILDNLNWIRWSKTKAAQDGTGMPTPILPKLLGLEEDAGDEDVIVFDSPEAYEAARARLLGGDQDA